MSGSAINADNKSTATPIEVVSCARGYVGTPYMDYGRTKGAGVDCIGLPVLVGHELGMFTGDFSAYTSTPDGRHAEKTAGDHMKRLWHPESSAASLQLVAKPSELLGCVGLFWFSQRGEPQHFGIFGKHPMTGMTTLIHAHARLGKVVEHSMDSFWTKRLVGVYKLPNMEG